MDHFILDRVAQGATYPKPAAPAAEVHGPSSVGGE
jgi:hypothetical protein